jgi:hypothetical protein
VELPAVFFFLHVPCSEGRLRGEELPWQPRALKAKQAFHRLDDPNVLGLCVPQALCHGRMVRN